MWKKQKTFLKQCRSGGERADRDTVQHPQNNVTGPKCSARPITTPPPTTPTALWTGTRWASPRTGSRTRSPTPRPSWSTWWTPSATRRTRAPPPPRGSGRWASCAATWRCCRSSPPTSSTPSACRWAVVRPSLLLCCLFVVSFQGSTSTW